jgi:hypothetical protein
MQALFELGHVTLQQCKQFWAMASRCSKVQRLHRKLHDPKSSSDM